MNRYAPEGSYIARPENRETRATAEGLTRALERGDILEAVAKLCDGEKTIWVDICKNFLNKDGVLEKSVMPDLLHPQTSKSYSIWGESLKPYFEKYGK